MRFYLYLSDPEYQGCREWKDYATRREACLVAGQFGDSQMALIVEAEYKPVNIELGFVSELRHEYTVALIDDPSA